MHCIQAFELLGTKARLQCSGPGLLRVAGGKESFELRVCCFP